jgi:hypothetical protein
MGPEGNMRRTFRFMSVALILLSASSCNSIFCSVDQGDVDEYKESVSGENVDARRERIQKLYVVSD